jgi:hypothetical protein
MLQASSSEVYGNATVHPQREDHWGNVNPIGFGSMSAPVSPSFGLGLFCTAQERLATRA